MAPVISGHVRTQAIATALTVVLCLSAIGFNASRRARFRSRFGDLNSSPRRRQSSGANAATRLALKVSVRMPDCIGL
jgi:hypothetical protein